MRTKSMDAKHTQAHGKQTDRKQMMQHGMMQTPALLLMAAAHFAAMYLLMFAMVNTAGNVLPNLNQLYMAGIMTAPMIVLEIALMHSMYEDKRALGAILGISVAAFALFFVMLRNQTAVGDEEFLRSMIPHHGGAILMCQNASIQDPEVRELCQSIVASQQAEIDQMKTILERLD